MSLERDRFSKIKEKIIIIYQKTKAIMADKAAKMHFFRVFFYVFYKNLLQMKKIIYLILIHLIHFIIALKMVTNLPKQIH